jgi:uncharacterized protein YPO0396
MDIILKQLIDNMYEIKATLDKVEKKLNDIEEKINNLQNIQQNALPIKKPFKLEEFVYPDINYIT